MVRIKPTDTLSEIALKMAGGNPGAISVVMSMFRDGAVIDPDGFAAGLGAILSLDTYGIYEHRIWGLFKDVCGENLNATLAALRAVQLGFVPIAQLQHAIDNRGDGFDLTAACRAVKERLPDFVVPPDALAALDAVEAATQEGG